MCLRWILSVAAGSLMALACFSGCDDGDDTGHVKDAWLVAIGDDHPDTALRLADDALRQNPRDPVAFVRRAVSLSLLERHEDAVEAFRHAEAYGRRDAADRTALYFQARSLVDLRLYARGLAVLDTLAREFPQGRLTQKGRAVGVKVEKRLAQGVTKANLNWYLDKGVRASAAGRPALAAEYLEEFDLLSARAGQTGVAGHPLAGFTLGGAYLELGDVPQALACLEHVPPEYASYRAGTLKALALHAGGRTNEALALLRGVASADVEEEAKTRALKLLSEWETKRGDE